MAMLNIEEYIAKRKKEDKLNEFDIENKIENIKICIDYIFEYYNGYLDILEIDNRNILDNEELVKYRKRVRDFNTEVQDWLVELYDKYDIRMNKRISNILDKSEFFLLHSSESEFRSESYECYSKLIKKYPFLKEQTENLYEFIKDYHRLKSEMYLDENLPFLTLGIQEWLEKTQEKYGVNIKGFVYQYIMDFYDNTDRWPVKHKKKSNSKYEEYEYDYNQKKNLFNIDYIYPKISKKPFIRGHKQDIEIIMMYYWLEDIEGDNEYFKQYLEKVLNKN